MIIISLTDLNQKQTLNRIINKIRNNISLTIKEKVLFLLLPLMDLKHKVEVLKQTIYLTHKIKDLSEKEYES